MEFLELSRQTSFLGLKWCSLHLLKNLAYVAPVSYRPVSYKDKGAYPLSIHLSDPQQFRDPAQSYSLRKVCCSYLKIVLLKLVKVTLAQKDLKPFFDFDHEEKKG